ncbi:Hypothetical protein FKW44_020866 [Caligus rogercresseyi]|uniref:Uncharacterized protein n=1 Tax=Caligus rogercresseyi TaxID=217165 RepID=A0A7T8JUW8_CALRO|nr:Hypothetical protein FKW44_020866 [Caligus rogercresseyi]
MQNELNTNKYFKLAYSANRCACCEIGYWERFLSEFPSRGTLPVPLRRPSREKIRLGRLIRTRDGGGLHS